MINKFKELPIIKRLGVLLVINLICLWIPLFISHYIIMDGTFLRITAFTVVYLFEVLFILVNLLFLISVFEKKISVVLRTFLALIINLISKLTIVAVIYYTINSMVGSNLDAQMGLHLKALVETLIEWTVVCVSALLVIKSSKLKRNIGRVLIVILLIGVAGVNVYLLHNSWDELTQIKKYYMLANNNQEEKYSNPAPDSLYADNNKLYVSDAVKNTITVYSLDGKVLNRIKIPFNKVLPLKEKISNSCINFIPWFKIINQSKRVMLNSFALTNNLKILSADANRIFIKKHKMDYSEQVENAKFYEYNIKEKSLKLINTKDIYYLKDMPERVKQLFFNKLHSYEYPIGFSSNTCELYLINEYGQKNDNIEISKLNLKTDKRKVLYKSKKCKIEDKSGQSKFNTDEVWLLGYRSISLSGNVFLDKNKLYAFEYKYSMPQNEEITSFRELQESIPKKIWVRLTTINTNGELLNRKEKIIVNDNNKKLENLLETKDLFKIRQMFASNKVNKNNKFYFIDKTDKEKPYILVIDKNFDCKKIFCDVKKDRRSPRLAVDDKGNLYFVSKIQEDNGKINKYIVKLNSKGKLVWKIKTSEYK